MAGENPWYVEGKRTTSQVGDIVFFTTNSNDGGNYQTFYRDTYVATLESSDSPNIPDEDAS